MEEASFHIPIKNMNGYLIISSEIITILGNSTITRGMGMVEWTIRMRALMKASG